MKKKRTTFRDKFVKKKKKPKKISKRKIAVYGFFALALLLFLYLYTFLLDPVGKTEEMEGVTIALRQGDGSSSKTYVVIKLTNGDIININAAIMRGFKKGRKVLVQKKTSKNHKRTTYSFIKYLKD